MFKYVALIAWIILPAMLRAQNKDANKTDFEKLSWLAGTWNQTNITKSGKALTEHWTNSGNYEMNGQAITTQNGDTVYVERITLLVKDETIYYVADVPQNKQPVYFRLTSITANGFVCENPAHDFPKKITYTLTGNQLNATVSGNGKTIHYHYQKKE
ncbi:MAG TPA: DUF6265 family protein [Cyclobacteriaceae bacterium]|nr:DUF6265 family protein [Cyclobacteriaceae bacterium]